MSVVYHMTYKYTCVPNKHLKKNKRIFDKFGNLDHYLLKKFIAQIHRVRGQSVFFNLVLIERNMQVEFDLKLSVYSSGVDI